MTKDDIQDKRDSQPVLGKFVSREVIARPGKAATIVKHDLSVMDTESAGYDSYDNPAPPPTEAQIAEMKRRCIVGK